MQKFTLVATADLRMHFIKLIIEIQHTEGYGINNQIDPIGIRIYITILSITEDVTPSYLAQWPFHRLFQ